MYENIYDINILNNELINMKLENSNLKRKVKQIYNLENQLKEAKDKIKSLQLKNKNIIEEHNEEIRKYRFELQKLNKEKDFQQMNYDKRMILFDQKMGMVHHIELENEVYKDEINEIKEKNKKLEDSVKNKIVDLEIKNKINFGELKKKVMNDLKDAKRNILTLNMEHMDINGKIILFQNYKLLSQIEYQKQEIELLSQENKELKFRIFNLEKEVDINEKVKEKLASKLSSKINKSMNLFNKPSTFNKYKQDLFNKTKQFIINNTNKEKLIESNILNSSSTQYDNNIDLNLTFNKMKINKIKKYCLKDDEGNHSDSNKNDNYILQSPDKSKINNHISFNEIHTEKINKIKNSDDIINRKISLTKKNENNCIYNNEERKKKNKIIREQNYEIENLKLKVDNLKNKLSFYIDKYKGIYDFLDECINNFFSDIEDKNKNFLLRIDDIKRFNFENFTKEEKYSLLVLLVNHLLPLILYNFNSNCNIGNEIFSTNINIFNSTFDKKRNYLNDNTLKKAFFKKNNKLQKELFLKDNTFNNGSIPVLRKKNISVDLKIKDDKYKLVVK
jgi:N-terminal acetyltransferase B complex non-catalytic subunit